MYAVSQDFLEKTYALSRNVKYRVTCDSVTYTEADNLQSVNFYDSANSGTDLTVGSVCCNEVDIRLLNVDDVSFDGKEITVEAGLVIDEETIEYVPLGVFIVEEGDGTALTSVEGKKIVELKAFDRMSKFDTEFNADLLTETITAGELMAAICEELDVPLKTTVFPNSDYVVGNSASINTTYRKMVSYIAQLAGCFARFDRDGELELRWYAPVDLELTAANYISFQAAENTVPAIDKLSVKVEENDLGISYGSGENEYSIINNPLLYGLTAEPEETQETVLKNIFNNIAGIYTYIPYEANVRANPALETGDIVKITLANGSEYILPIMSRELNYSGGMTETYSAVGTSLNYTKPRSVVNEKIEALRRKTNVLESTLDGTKSQVTLIAADVGNLRTTLEQTATGILSEVSQNYPDNTTVQSMIQQATDAVSLRFSQTGGRNAIKDSCGIYGLNAWTKTGIVSAQDTTDTTAKKCIVITNGSAEQTDIDIVPDTDYILCFRYKTSGTGVSEYAYSVNAETPVELEAAEDWTYVVRNFTFAQTASIKFETDLGTLYISDLVMLQGVGDNPVVWQQAEGETHNGTVKLSEDGIVIGRSSSEFEGKYTHEGVYYKNKNTQQDVARFTKDGATFAEANITGEARIGKLRFIPTDTGVFMVIDD